MSVHETQLSAARNQDKKIGKRTFSKLRWSLIAIFGVFVVLLQYSAPSLFEIQSIVFTILLFVVAIFHGVERYGARNTTVFFFITWAVSLFFEALSVHTGFPFSLYHYAMPLIIPGFGVPLTVIFAYFAAGYFSWMLSHVLTEQYSAKLNGKWIVVVPFIAAFTMVMWDLGMDPLLSSVLKQWVWQTPGPYFGVPVMNYAGWFLVVFIFYLLFALFLSRVRSDSAAKNEHAQRQAVLDRSSRYIRSYRVEHNSCSCLKHQRYHAVYGFSNRFHNDLCRRHFVYHNYEQ